MAFRLYRLPATLELAPPPVAIKPGTLCLVVRPRDYPLAEPTIYYGTTCVVIGPLEYDRAFVGGYFHGSRMWDGYVAGVARVCLVPITPPSIPETETTHEPEEQPA